MTTVTPPPPVRFPSTRPRPGSVDAGGFRAAPSPGRPFSSTVRRGWNGLKTAVLLGGLGGLFVVLGAQFGEIGAAVGLLLGVGTVAGSYRHSDRLALRAAGAVPVGSNDFPLYHRIVRELTAEAGLPMPRLYVTPDAQPNAFATGATPGTRRSRSPAACWTCSTPVSCAPSWPTSWPTWATATSC